MRAQVGKKRAGTWLGPNTVCSAFSSLHAESKCADICGMQLLLLDRGDGDNTIYLEEARDCLSNGPTLILLPVRLGMHTIDRSYLRKVEHVFSLPQSVGFIGGRPVRACACAMSSTCASAPFLATSEIGSSEKV